MEEVIKLDFVKEEIFIANFSSHSKQKLGLSNILIASQSRI